ncbi:MAG: hypothetical protein Q7S70_00495 [bacterium]|nr:hypothetical protein [bacterium]
MVKIYRGKPGWHIDKRRIIIDTVFREGMVLPFPIKQVKVIDFSREGVDQAMAVGNHYHSKESGRQEFFTVLGAPESSLCLSFRWRKAGQEKIEEKGLMNGDGVYVPPGYSHAFVPLMSGVKLLGLSNLPFRDEDDIADKLF